MRYSYSRYHWSNFRHEIHLKFSQSYPIIGINSKYYYNLCTGFLHCLHFSFSFLFFRNRFSRSFSILNTELGGVGRITNVHYMANNEHNDEKYIKEPIVSHVDVSYFVMGGRESKIPVEYVKLAPQYEQNTSSSNAKLNSINKNKSLRNRLLSKGRCTVCKSFRSDCGSCDFKLQQKQEQEQLQIRQKSNSRYEKNSSKTNRKKITRRNNFFQRKRDTLKIKNNIKNNDSNSDFEEDYSKTLFISESDESDSNSSEDTDELMSRIEKRRRKYKRLEANRLKKRKQINKPSSSSSSNNSSISESNSDRVVNNDDDDESMFDTDSETDIDDSDNDDVRLIDLQPSFPAQAQHLSQSFDNESNGKSEHENGEEIMLNEYVDPQDTNNFIQPEGSQAAHQLPQDINDLTSNIPFMELPKFFTEVADKLAYDLIPDAKLKVSFYKADIRKYKKQRSNKQSYEVLSNEGDELYNKYFRELHCDGIDQCRQCLRRINDTKERRNMKRELNKSEYLKMKRELEHFELKSDLRSENLQSTVRDVLKDIQMTVDKFRGEEEEEAKFQLLHKKDSHTSNSDDDMADDELGGIGESDGNHLMEHSPLQMNLDSADSPLNPHPHATRMRNREEYSHTPKQIQKNLKRSRKESSVSASSDRRVLFREKKEDDVQESVTGKDDTSNETAKLSRRRVHAKTGIDGGIVHTNTKVRVRNRRHVGDPLDHKGQKRSQNRRKRSKISSRDKTKKLRSEEKKKKSRRKRKNKQRSTIDDPLLIPKSSSSATTTVNSKRTIDNSSVILPSPTKNIPDIGDTDEVDNNENIIEVDQYTFPTISEIYDSLECSFFSKTESNIPVSATSSTDKVSKVRPAKSISELCKIIEDKYPTNESNNRNTIRNLDPNIQILDCFEWINAHFVSHCKENVTVDNATEISTPSPSSRNTDDDMILKRQCIHVMEMFYSLLCKCDGMTLMEILYTRFACDEGNNNHFLSTHCHLLKYVILFLSSLKDILKKDPNLFSKKAPPSSHSSYQQKQYNISNNTNEKEDKKIELLINVFVKNQEEFINSIILQILDVLYSLIVKNAWTITSSTSRKPDDNRIGPNDENETKSSMSKSHWSSQNGRNIDDVENVLKLVIDLTLSIVFSSVSLLESTSTPVSISVGSFFERLSFLLINKFLCQKKWKNKKNGVEFISSIHPKSFSGIIRNSSASLGSKIDKCKEKARLSIFRNKIPRQEVNAIFTLWGYLTMRFFESHIYEKHSVEAHGVSQNVKLATTGKANRWDIIKLLTFSTTGTLASVPIISSAGEKEGLTFLSLKPSPSKEHLETSSNELRQVSCLLESQVLNTPPQCDEVIYKMIQRSSLLFSSYYAIECSHNYRKNIFNGRDSFKEGMNSLRQLWEEISEFKGFSDMNTTSSADFSSFRFIAADFAQILLGIDKEVKEEQICLELSPFFEFPYKYIDKDHREISSFSLYSEVVTHYIIIIYNWMTSVIGLNISEKILLQIKKPRWLRLKKCIFNNLIEDFLKKTEQLNSNESQKKLLNNDIFHDFNDRRDKKELDSLQVCTNIFKEFSAYIYLACSCSSSTLLHRRGNVHTNMKDDQMAVSIIDTFHVFSMKSALYLWNNIVKPSTDMKQIQSSFYNSTPLPSLSQPLTHNNIRSFSSKIMSTSRIVSSAIRIYMFSIIKECVTCSGKDVNARTNTCSSSSGTGSLSYKGDCDLFFYITCLVSCLKSCDIEMSSLLDNNVHKNASVKLCEPLIQTLTITSYTISKILNQINSMMKSFHENGNSKNLSISDKDAHFKHIRSRLIPNSSSDSSLSLESLIFSIIIPTVRDCLETFILLKDDGIPSNSEENGSNRYYLNLCLRSYLCLIKSCVRLVHPDNSNRETDDTTKTKNTNSNKGYTYSDVTSYELNEKTSSTKENHNKEDDLFGNLLDDEAFLNIDLEALVSKKNGGNNNNVDGNHESNTNSKTIQDCRKILLLSSYRESSTSLKKNPYNTNSKHARQHDNDKKVNLVQLLLICLKCSFPSKRYSVPLSSSQLSSSERRIKLQEIHDVNNVCSDNFRISDVIDPCVKQSCHSQSGGLISSIASLLTLLPSNEDEHNENDRSGQSMNKTQKDIFKKEKQTSNLIDSYFFSSSCYSYEEEPKTKRKFVEDFNDLIYIKTNAQYFCLEVCRLANNVVLPSKKPSSLPPIQRYFQAKKTQILELFLCSLLDSRIVNRFPISSLFVHKESNNRQTIDIKQSEEPFDKNDKVKKHKELLLKSINRRKSYHLSEVTEFIRSSTRITNPTSLDLESSWIKRRKNQVFDSPEYLLCKHLWSFGVFLGQQLSSVTPSDNASCSWYKEIGAILKSTIETFSSSSNCQKENVQNVIDKFSRGSMERESCKRYIILEKLLVNMLQKQQYSREEGPSIMSAIIFKNLMEQLCYIDDTVRYNQNICSFTGQTDIDYSSSDTDLEKLFKSYTTQQIYVDIFSSSITFVLRNLHHLRSPPLLEYHQKHLCYVHFCRDYILTPLLSSYTQQKHPNESFSFQNAMQKVTIQSKSACSNSLNVNDISGSVYFDIYLGKQHQNLSNFSHFHSGNRLNNLIYHSVFMSGILSKKRRTHDLILHIAYHPEDNRNKLHHAIMETTLQQSYLEDGIASIVDPKESHKSFDYLLPFFVGYYLQGVETMNSEDGRDEYNVERVLSSLSLKYRIVQEQDISSSLNNLHHYVEKGTIEFYQNEVASYFSKETGHISIHKERDNIEQISVVRNLRRDVLSKYLLPRLKNVADIPHQQKQQEKMKRTKIAVLKMLIGMFSLPSSTQSNHQFLYCIKINYRDIHVNSFQPTTNNYHSFSDIQEISHIFQALAFCLLQSTFSCYFSNPSYLTSDSQGLLNSEIITYSFILLQSILSLQVCFSVTSSSPSVATRHQYKNLADWLFEKEVNVNRKDNEIESGSYKKYIFACVQWITSLAKVIINDEICSEICETFSLSKQSSNEATCQTLPFISFWRRVLTQYNQKENQKNGSNNLYASFHKDFFYLDQAEQNVYRFSSINDQKNKYKMAKFSASIPNPYNKNNSTYVDEFDQDTIFSGTTSRREMDLRKRERYIDTRNAAMSFLEYIISRTN